MVRPIRSESPCSLTPWLSLGGAVDGEQAFQGGGIEMLVLHAFLSFRRDLVVLRTVTERLHCV